MNNLFENYGFIRGGILNITPREAFELCSMGAVIVDVREEYLNNFKNLDAREVVLLPKSTLINDYIKLPKSKFLIFADSVGLRSKEAILFLKDKGYKYIANMAGGIVEWERDGLPLKTDIQSRLTGSCMCQLKPREGKRKGEGK